jgi:carboxylesterase type B
MLNINEAKTAAKALYLQAASMSGYEVSDQSPSRISDLVQEWFTKVGENRRPEAVASILKIIAATLEKAQKNKVTMLHESDVDNGKDDVCPIYPNDRKKI